jgi:hypothetical protein
VVAIGTGVRDLERQLVDLASAYTLSIERQAQSLVEQEQAVRTRLAALPGQAQGNLRLQREVRRLSQTALGLKAQLIDTRLAAIGEGGQVRVVDAALPAKRMTFPRPLPTLVVAALLGLLGGAVWAVVRAAASTRLRTAADVDRASGLPVAFDRPGRALLLGADLTAGTLLVVPVDHAARAAAAAVANRLVGQAAERGHRVALVDAAAQQPAALVAAVAGAELAHDLVVALVPAVDDRRAAAVLAPSRTALLVALAGVSRAEALTEAADVVARVGVPCAGVVLVSAAGAARGGSDGRGDRDGVGAPDGADGVLAGAGGAARPA